MRIQLAVTLTVLLFSPLLFAKLDSKTKAEAEELTREYEAIFSNNKFLNIDKVFSEDFLKALGGKESFIKNVEATNKNQKQKYNPDKLEIYIHEGLPIVEANLKTDDKKTPPKKIEEVIFSSFIYKGEKKKAMDLPTWLVLKRDSEGRLRVSGTVATEGEK